MLLTTFMQMVNITLWLATVTNCGTAERQHMLIVQYRTDVLLHMARVEAVFGASKQAD